MLIFFLYKKLSISIGLRIRLPRRKSLREVYFSHVFDSYFQMFVWAELPNAPATIGKYDFKKKKKDILTPTYNPPPNSSFYL